MTYFGCMCCRHNRRDYVIGGPVQEDERPPIETISPESVWRSDLQATCDLAARQPTLLPTSCLLRVSCRTYFDAGEGTLWDTASA